MASLVCMDIHIPLVFLGPKDLSEELSKSDERHTKRLETIYAGLKQMLQDDHNDKDDPNHADTPILLWNPSPFDNRVLDHDTEEMAEQKRAEKEAWVAQQKRAFDSWMHSGKWILRATPRSEDERPVGMWEGWRPGDGLLTGEEKSLAFRNELWTLAFTLQRFGLSASKREERDREIERVLGCLEMISRGESRERGRILSVVAGERCVPHIGFQAAHGEMAMSFEEQTVVNLVLLVTAFERELLPFSTPSFLLTYHPLTHFLTMRTVRAMRRQRNAIWEGLATKAGARQMRKERDWQRNLAKWIDDFKVEDEKAKRRDELIGEKGQEWWADLRQSLQDGEIANIIEDMATRTSRGSTRLMLGLRAPDETISGKENERTKAWDILFPSNDLASRFEDSGNMKYDGCEASLPPTPPQRPPIPSISSISFPIPIRGLAAQPLIAYIDLLSHLLLFAAVTAEDDVYAYIRDARRVSRILEETPTHTLAGLATHVDTSASSITALKEDVERFADSARADGPVSVDQHLERREEIGREKDPFKEVERFIWESYEEGRRFTTRESKGGEGKVGFLERYESVGGWMVPDKTKVYQLLVVQGGKWKRFSGNEGDSDDGE
ncbi:hypothetical protein N0V90_010088 [Kalmusia sp. IMI 367209]|nr:hypothetical protein N0V90_010088 [Kalmusia sp. IMI 367209]